MANYINQTFDKWQLTNAEHDIAWLIIKGYSFKEIAHIRKVSGKTISQQTSIIYKKSNVSNRHELMSNFLEEFINFK
ncbi:helix-turn-helix transcriptional regulator [Bathymodiolus thermophilus thioautotrophic gill symbiont]|nr:helix-turn-helix transcriptional regulator [Bathymodiolus thermophilus thioautotrophic gill symbiont]